jgi:hypothetical protein
MTPLIFETATFQLVAQCLKQLRHRLPPSTGLYVMEMIAQY